MLPEAVTQCVAVVFREIRMPRLKEAFVRPISPSADFVVATDGSVSFADEKWLALIQLEEETLKAERRGVSDDVSTEVDEGEQPVAGAAATPDTATPDTATPASTATGRADPGADGQKHKLGDTDVEAGRHGQRDPGNEEQVPDGRLRFGRGPGEKL